MGTRKGVGRLYQQTVIDTDSNVAFAQFSDCQNALVAAEALDDRVLPWCEEQAVAVLRILTDRGTAYCGSREQHEYPLSLAGENIDPSKTQARSPQSNGPCERFPKTQREEFYRVAFRKKRCQSLPDRQADLDHWLQRYNRERPHSGRYGDGKTPWQTFLERRPLAQDKQLDRHDQPPGVPGG